MERQDVQEVMLFEQYERIRESDVMANRRISVDADIRLSSVGASHEPTGSESSPLRGVQSQHTLHSVRSKQKSSVITPIECSGSAIQGTSHIHVLCVASFPVPSTYHTSCYMYSAIQLNPLVAVYVYRISSITCQRCPRFCSCTSGSTSRCQCSC